MPYEPNFPKPKGDAIDVNSVGGNEFMCLINAKDKIEAYEIKILAMSNGAQICSLRGSIVDNVNKKFKKIGTTDPEEISIPSTDSKLPFQGSYTDDSWLNINVPTGLGLVNGYDYKWNITLYETNPTIKVTEGYVQAYTSDTPSITLQSNSNIKEGMYVKCKAQLEKITLWNSETKIATIESAFTETVVQNDMYEIYSPFITSKDYYFKARTFPVTSLNINTIDENDTIHSSSATFSLGYSQAENIGIKHYMHNLYLGSKLIATTGEVISSDTSFTYDGFLNDKIYRIESEIVTNDEVKIKDGLSKVFNVSYTELKTFALPIVSVNNYKTCIDIDYSKNSDIAGVLEGDQTITLSKFKNSAEDIDPTDTNAVSLSKYQNLYWNKVNNVSPLEIPDNFTYYHHCHLSRGYSGSIFEIINEEDDSTIRVRYDGTKFYCKIGMSDELYYDPYTGGSLSAIQPSGTIVDNTKLYIINSTDVLNSTDIIIFNDLGYDYWWNIIVRPYATLDTDKFKVYKSIKYSESVVS